MLREWVGTSGSTPRGGSVVWCPHTHTLLPYFFGVNTHQTVTEEVAQFEHWGLPVCDPLSLLWMTKWRNGLIIRLTTRQRGSPPTVPGIFFWLKSSSAGIMHRNGDSPEIFLWAQWVVTSMGCVSSHMGPATKGSGMKKTPVPSDPVFLSLYSFSTSLHARPLKTAATVKEKLAEDWGRGPALLSQDCALSQGTCAGWVMTSSHI